jgi:hypothetical protein
MSREKIKHMRVAELRLFELQQVASVGDGCCLDALHELLGSFEYLLGIGRI